MTATEVAELAGSDGVAVPGDIGKQQTGDTAGPATGCVVNIAAALRLTVRLAVDPGVEAAEFNPLRGKLAASPHFHALHLLRGPLAHSGNIA